MGQTVLVGKEYEGTPPLFLADALATSLIPCSDMGSVPFHTQFYQHRHAALP